MPDIEHTLTFLRVKTAGNNAPASPVVGQKWLNTSTNQVSIYNGSTWIAVAELSTVPFILEETSGEFFVRGGGVYNKVAQATGGGGITSVDGDTGPAVDLSAKYIKNQPKSVQLTHLVDTTLSINEKGPTIPMWVNTTEGGNPAWQHIPTWLSQQYFNTGTVNVGDGTTLYGWHVNQVINVNSNNVTLGSAWGYLGSHYTLGTNTIFNGWKAWIRSVKDGGCTISPQSGVMINGTSSLHIDKGHALCVYFDGTEFFTIEGSTDQYSRATLDIGPEIYSTQNSLGADVDEKVVILRDNAALSLYLDKVEEGHLFKGWRCFIFNDNGIIDCPFAVVAPIGSTINGRRVAYVETGRLAEVVCDGTNFILTCAFEADLNHVRKANYSLVNGEYYASGRDNGRTILLGKTNSGEGVIKIDSENAGDYYRDESTLPLGFLFAGWSATFRNTSADEGKPTIWYFQPPVVAESDDQGSLDKIDGIKVAGSSKTVPLYPNQEIKIRFDGELLSTDSAPNTIGLPRLTKAPWGTVLGTPSDPRKLDPDTGLPQTVDNITTLTAAEVYTQAFVQTKAFLFEARKDLQITDRDVYNIAMPMFTVDFLNSGMIVTIKFLGSNTKTAATANITWKDGTTSTVNIYKFLSPAGLTVGELTGDISCQVSNGYIMTGVITPVSIKSLQGGATGQFVSWGSSGVPSWTAPMTSAQLKAGTDTVARTVSAAELRLAGVPTYDYSAIETWTGLKWVDGKKVYRKTIAADVPVVEPYVSHIIPHNIANVDTIWPTLWFIVLDADGQETFATLSVPNAMFVNAALTKTELILEVGTQTLPCKTYVVLEYTCTDR